VDRERGVGARELERAGEVAADDRVGRGCFGLHIGDRRLLLELVEARLELVDLGLEILRLVGECRPGREGEDRA